MAPHYVLTLVHGTWASTKGWVSVDSFLRRELQRRLGMVTFREFSWTGTNTHAARIDAGVRLARFIRDGDAQHPGAQHFVIAHSHGGNVTLYAMRDPAVRDVVQGVVTLGTPFIYTRRRGVHRRVDAIAWLMLGVMALFPFALLDALHLTRLSLAWLVAAMFLVVKMQPAVARWLLDTVTLEQADIEASYQPPTVDPARLAVLCTRRDEVRRWLRTWDVLGRAPFVVGCALLVVVDAATRLRLNVPAFADGLAAKVFHQGFEDLHILGGDGWTLVVGGLVLCVVWSVVLLGAGIVQWPGYSREPLLVNLLVEIGTDRIPRGARGATGAKSAKDGALHVAQTFDVPAPPRRNQRIRRWLRHGAICADTAVVGAIADWIGAKGAR